MKDPFYKNEKDYDEWYENHSLVFEMEKNIISELIPKTGRGIEIGVGTGRFAKAFGIAIGVDSSPAMANFAQEKGIQVIRSAIENVQGYKQSFDYALLVTTLCMIEKLKPVLEIVKSMLKPGGAIIIGEMDFGSSLGEKHWSQVSQGDYGSLLFRHSVEDILQSLQEAGFKDIYVRQTLFDLPADVTTVNLSKEGYGEGLFVAIRAIRP